VLPLQIREFFDQLFHLLMVLHRFPDALFPVTRHKQLAQLSSLPPDQIEAGMKLASGAATAWFPAANIAQGESAAEEPGGVDDLGQAGTAAPFAIRELGALHKASAILRTTVYKKHRFVKPEARMRICYQRFRKGQF
jgi:hypothetical protein